MKRKFAFVEILVVAMLASGVCFARTERGDLDYTGKHRIQHGIETDTISEFNGSGNGVTIDSVVIKDGGITLIDAIVSAATPTTSYGLGALNTTNVTSVVENGDGLTHQTVITLTGTATAIADGGFEASQMLYTFPAGVINIKSVTCDITATMDTTNFNATANDLYNFALGSAVNDDGDGTISATGANMVPNISVDTGSGQTRTNAVEGFLVSPVNLDGTTTAISMYANWAVPAANDKGANTNHFTGTITVNWENAGNY